MERPKCRLCGARHYASEPHKFAADAVSVPVSLPEPDVSVPETPSGNLTDSVSVPDGLTKQQRWRLKNRDRYNASQRELMRKRRKSDG